MVDILFIAAIIGTLVFIVLFFLLPRIGPHYTSRLVCPKCRKTFNYHWLPGGSFAGLLSGSGKRTLRCPYCHEKSTFDVVHTRISKAKPEKPAHLNPKNKD
jgi:hypothetical protein